MKKVRWVAIISLIVALMVVGWVGCAPATTPPAEEKPPVKLGIVTYLTGEGKSSQGDIDEHATQLAVDQINAEGGILGGRQVVWKAFDQGYTDDVTTAAVKEAITVWGAQAIFGPQWAGGARVGLGVCQEYGIPMSANQGELGS